jgi:23S rRNA (cytidine1920-2'-O)/16S rRNA (cytidine1409-2'-O)-methyltransferase
MLNYVSRAGYKLAFALSKFKISVKNKVCIDLGCSTGGFVECLLKKGAKRVYAVDVGYGVLDWKLRTSPKVRVMERTNALYTFFPEKVDIITVDLGWTRLEKVLVQIKKWLKENGKCIVLIKPHYEASDKDLVKGVLPVDKHKKILVQIEKELILYGFVKKGLVPSPLKGKRGGNVEYLLYMEKRKE